MSALDAAYEPSDIEPRLYEWWEASGFFHAEPDDSGEPFCIVIPLPNVTGSLHLGHALNQAMQDAFIRWQRMCGANAMWQPGMDHAGIATQNVVERQLAQEGMTRHDLGREAFVERVWRWKEESGGLILSQMRRLGASCDWDREAFTLDEPRSRAVRKVFCDLYDQGLIYQGNRLINWCPRCATALSDIEVEHEDAHGELVQLRYPAWDGDGHDGVVVATTRAETMLGDTAVAVHPHDERYARLVGTTLRLPLVERRLPVVADEAVDPEFGTGAVKVTPAHDPNDYEIAQRHGLPVIDIMTDGAAINENVPAYEGLDRYEARERVKADLDALGLLVGVEPRTVPLGRCSRCATPVEPRLSDQWFVRVRPLADAAAAAVREERTRLVPERNTKGFLQWLDDLHDWCISRQLWWGHRIPAWYDEDGGVHVLREDPPEDSGLRRDPDVLDTWFSSALWPFSTLGWPEDTSDLRTWYPTSLLVTGYDINTFWVSRMLMLGLRFLDEVPFHVVVNHGMVRDEHGKKMSKSFGNVIDPTELMESEGADALRFALLRNAAPGTDAPLGKQWVEGARRFGNKLWNAARFVLGELDGVRPGEGLPPAGELTVEDRWVLSRLEATRDTVDDALASYDLAQVSRALYHFLWDEYCDWYLELAKLREDDVAPQVLAHCLDVALRLLHPVMPFLTEEIWRALHGRPAADAATPADDPTIMRAAWPAADPTRHDGEAERHFAGVQEVVGALRRFRADHDLAPSTRIDVVAVANSAQRPVLEAGLDGISRLAGVREWRFAEDPPTAGPVGELLTSAGELFVPLADLIDLDEERKRLSRERDRAHAEIERAEGKLADERFVAKAPDHVVQSERDKLDQWRATLDKLEAQLAELG